MEHIKDGRCLTCSYQVYGLPNLFRKQNNQLNALLGAKDRFETIYLFYRPMNFSSGGPQLPDGHSKCQSRKDKA